MSKLFYLTTPLYYVNGAPHVGHAYTTAVADAIARYKRMCGLEVCLLTGTDEHGLNIERAARQEGMTPQNLANLNARAFEETWKKLAVDFDEFIRTTEKRHLKTATDIFRKIEENGFIYLGQYSGHYCVKCEAYVSEGERTCPDCGRPAEFMTEESYFFKLSAFQEKLLSFYQDNPGFVIPATRMNEIISFVNGGLRDLSISRTSFQWGIPLPGDKKHILYVWFDALMGYLSGVGYANNTKRFQKHWPADVQLIGKDILRFHAVYWPAFLIAAGLEPPRHILVNGWWTVNGEKMSKSRGNFTTVEELANLLRPDYIKYFLLREIALGADGNFSYEAVLTRVNSDLANDLGNLVTRTLTMIENYFDGKIPSFAEPEGSDDDLRQFSLETIHLYRENFDRLQINRALDNVWELVSVVNKYLVAHEPWNLSKHVSKKARLGTVLYNAAEALRIIAVLLSPVIPEGTARILKQLGVAESIGKLDITHLNWGGLEPDSKIDQVVAVYPRLDPKQFMASVEKQKKKQEVISVSDEATVGASVIGVGDFLKLEMRVGKIVSAEPIAKSKKLLKLQIDIGAEVRQVVAGLGKDYSPKTLPGRLVVVVTNLQPAKLMGVESNGMIVAASDQGRPILATFTEPVKIGVRLK